MRTSIKLKWLMLSLFLMVFSAAVFMGLAEKAEAHFNNPYNWAPPPSGNCVTSAPWTGYWMYANTSSSVISLPYGTSATSFSMFAETKVCPGAPYDQAFNAYFEIWNVNGNISGLGNYNMGTVGKGPGGVFASWPNQSQSKWITVNTNSIKNSPGNHNFCFNWRGHADYGGGKNEHHTTGVQTFCIDIYIQPQPTGTLQINKYGEGGATYSDLNGCRMFIFAQVAGQCTGNGASKAIAVNAGGGYDVQGFPDSGFKVTRIRVNRYGPGCGPCESNYYGQERVNNLTVHAGNTTHVDIFYEPAKGTLQIVKYPERGATNANLSATAKNGSGGNIFTVSTSQGTNSASVNVASNYQATMSPAAGFRVTRVRVNRQTGSGIATICDPCAVSGNTISGISVVDSRITWVDVFYEPDIRGSLDDVCSKPNENGTPVSLNGKIRGWVIDYFYPQNANNKAITPSTVEVNIDGSVFEVDIVADKERPDLPINTSNPQVGRWHGFEMDMPAQFFDGNSHTVRIYPLRGGAGIGSPPYTLATRQFNCGGPKGTMDVADCSLNNSQGTIAGWGFDPQRPGTSPNFHFYFDSTPTNTSDPDARFNRDNVVGSVLRPDVVTSLRNQGYPGVLDATKYGFSEPFPNGLHDGEPHVVRVYLITQSGANPKIGEAGVQGSASLVCEAWYYPWMQTQNGDVIASGKITGQVSDEQLLGSRLPNNPEKETEYLVISALANGGPFCSTYNYILTLNGASGTNCGNSAGYTVLNKYQLGDNANDNVYKAIEKAYTTNGAGNPAGGANTKCSPYNTFTALPSVNLDTATSSVAANNCLNGTVFKLPPSNNFGGFNVIAGRVTIFIDGSIDITNNIKYTYVGYSNPKAVPNLAIIVRGNVNIGPNVTQLDAAIYATGKINTCQGYNPAVASSTVACNQRLVVNGMLVGKDGFSFGRSFYSQTNRNSAEFISLTGQTVAFPPPGLDSSNFSEFDNSVRIDSGEFQPRF